MSGNDELIAQFIEMSGSDDTVARFYLSSSNWSLETALSNFLGNQSENEDAASAPETEKNDDLNRHSNRTGARSGSSTAASTFDSKSTRKPKFATLGDMAQRPTNEDEGQAFYAGGSERSGQQVLGPPKQKNFREQLTDMFRMAQEQGTSEDSPTPSTSSGASWGQGMRLGMTSNDHIAIKVPNANKGDGEKGPVVILKLWSQGFSIDDGELRLYDDPDNKEFLETVMRGEIPEELLERGWMVSMDVEDHRREDYKKTAVVKTFKGSGHTLGSPAPNTESTTINQPSGTAASPTVPTENVADSEKIAKEKLKLNDSAPRTTLQIRLADGTRLTAQFNLTHTVADIQNYIQTARPQYANQNFRLVSSFPTQELSDTTTTIEAARLQNAAIMQRII